MFLIETPMHGRHVPKSKNLEGHAVMRRAAAAGGAFWSAKKWGGVRPPCLPLWHMPENRPIYIFNEFFWKIILPFITCSLVTSIYPGFAFRSVLTPQINRENRGMPVIESILCVIFLNSSKTLVCQKIFRKTKTKLQHQDSLRVGFLQTNYFNTDLKKLEI